MLRRYFSLLLLGATLMPGLSHASDLPPPPPNEIELGTSHDALDKGYSNWNSTYLDGLHRFGARQSVYGELRETQRFNLYDREISGGYYHPLGESWTSLIEASMSPDHHVLAQNSLFGQLQKSFADGWDVQAGLRHSTYTNASSNMVVLTGERYWGDYRASYKLYLSKLPGAGTAPNNNAQLSYYYTGTGRDFLTLGLSKGRQVESLGPGLGVLITDVTNVSVSGRHWLTPAWGLSYEATMEHQGNLYSRKGIRLGLRYAF
jgi:YaiO family outer membrane protein